MTVLIASGILGVIDALLPSIALALGDNDTPVHLDVTVSPWLLQYFV